MTFPSDKSNEKSANQPALRTLVDELLAEQQKLTAVDRFSRLHATNGLPAQAKYYRDLIPLTKPQPGQQYAFEVDLDKCSGCKACVTACHSLNGLDEAETWRSVGLLFNDDWHAPQQQTITTACHHCVEPGCLEGCPVLAYDKDPVTGIVRHLDDQCIGCQYCVMKCPYEVPQYSAKRGIVRKCDMCANRLAVDEAPACVQACPHEAIKITVVDTSAIKNNFRLISPTPVTGNSFLPSSPAPQITLPTTRYKSTKPLPTTLLAADHARVSPAHSHLPLVFMLVLTQLAVGASVAAIFSDAAKLLAMVAAGVSAGALGIASLHLGKPLKAWRAFLGWRKSWFSREVIVFGGYVLLAMTAAASFWFVSLAPFQKLLTLAAATTGLLGVVCSAMIYVDTRREFWRVSQCFGKFFGTTLLLGAATVLAITNAANWLVVAMLLGATVVKLGFENRIFQQLVDVDTFTLTSLNKTARLLTDELGLAARLRVFCGIMGGVVLPLFLLANPAATGLAAGALALCVVGELLERYLFFTAVAPAKMPGGFAA